MAYHFFEAYGASVKVGRIVNGKENTMRSDIMIFKEVINVLQQSKPQALSEKL
jgi:hypothetical protein